ncbi:MAG: 3-phosphoshikimate 1-carboxyvinyltransferase, partial [Woeseiaceae bacterium]|nr:3-phosphoshikimate 1-carboxyvinyltransferase [Woeseiaceae bacterium]
ARQMRCPVTETLGANVSVTGQRICLAGGQRLAGAAVRVPGDLSSAAFPMLAAILSKDAELLIKDVGVNPTRTGVLDILRAMGADIEAGNERHFGAEPVADLRVRASRLVGGAVDPGLVSLAIDEFPVLFVAAAAAEGRTEFSGIGELRVKESDRIASMAAGLRALGIDVDETPDGATITGGRFRTGRAASHGDHRVAMALAVAATIADGPVEIDDVAPVATSFPDFAGHLRGIGVDIRVEEGARDGG